MKFLTVLALAASMLAADGAKDKPDRQSQEALLKEEQKSLNGVWIVESIAWPNEGKRELKGMRCAISSDKVSITLPGEDKPSGGILIRIDPTKKPKTIDVFESPPPGKSKEDALKNPPVLGIYELQGETLRISWVPLEQRERPKAFPSKPGGGQSLLVLKRQKPEGEKR